MGRFSTVFLISNNQMVLPLAVGALTFLGSPFLGCQQKMADADLLVLEKSLGNWQSFEDHMQQFRDDEQDLLRLRLAVRNPKYSQYLCSKIHSSIALEKCTQVIGRPHLQKGQP